MDVQLGIAKPEAVGIAAEPRVAVRCPGRTGRSIRSSSVDCLTSARVAEYPCDSSSSVAQWTNSCNFSTRNFATGRVQRKVAFVKRIVTYGLPILVGSGYYLD